MRPRRRRRARGAVALVAAAAFLSALVPVAGATTYPAGASRFNGSAEGWALTEAECEPPSFCQAGGGYDGGNGNPPGSLVASTNVALNLVSLFESSVEFQSPRFEVGADGAATLHLDRAFSSGLIDLQPVSTYTVSLTDQRTGDTSELLSETLDPSDSEFLGKDAAASVKGGHTYVLAIETATESTVVGTGLTGGSTDTRFDNIGLEVTPGAGSATGSGPLSDARLKALLLSGGVPRTAVLAGRGKAKRLLVRVKCPRQAGHSCRIAAQGMLNRRKPATARRAAKVRAGKTKLLVLRVKPRLAKKIAKRKRLLVRETVRVAKAKATVYRMRKLLRR